MIEFIGTSVIIAPNYNHYSVIADLHNFKVIVTYALRFSVITSRLQVTELKQSHCD
jgi:hypothetical protein